MKGNRQLEMAELIGRRFSEYPSVISFNKKLELYSEYSALIKKKAYLGNPKAQFCYAQLFDTMTFIDLENPLYNPKKCIYWYTKAAEGDMRRHITIWQIFMKEERGFSKI